MHYLKILLEPLALVMLGWAFITFQLWRKKQSPWRFSLILLLGFWFIASPLGANSLLWLLERNYQQAVLCPEFPAQAPVVVLGGGKKGSNARPDQVEVLMEATFIRTFAGLQLWQQRGTASEIIVSGGGFGSVKEADLMAFILRQAGVPAESLLLERMSNTTAENAEGVHVLMAEHADKHIYLVTSALHMPRARATFESAGMIVCPWPVDQQAFMPDVGGLWIPSLRPLQKSSRAIHEFKGLVWYSLTGRL